MKSLFVFVISVLLITSVGGCMSKEDGAPSGEYSVEISNVVTKVERENTYESLASKSVFYSITGDVLLKKNGVEVEDSGELTLSFAETTGFNDFGDRPGFISIPILKGVGRLDTSFANANIPIAKGVVPPRLNYRFGTFLKYESAAEYLGGEAKSSEKLVMLEVEPVKVVEGKSSYMASVEVRIKGKGALVGETFSLMLLRSTLEHPDSSLVGERQLIRAVVNKGEGKFFYEPYLGLVNELDQNLDSRKVPAPSAPKYRFEILGIFREDDVSIVIK